MITYQDSPIYQDTNAAREKFKPENIKILFVAEAPPDALERFFYYPNVKNNDWLYLGIVKALCCYPTTTNDDRMYSCDTNKIRAHKGKILELLKKDGFYLMDLSPLPKSNVSPESFKPDFIKRLDNETAADKTDTKIILIKANVFDCLYEPLKGRGYAVQEQRIPFPASGQQQNFAIEMEKALKAINYQPGEGVEKIKTLICS